MTHTTWEVFEPVLDDRVGLRRYDFEVMQAWGMEQLGTLVPSDREEHAVVWFGQKTVNSYGEIPVVGASLPKEQLFTVENSRWFWGLAVKSEIELETDMHAAMLDQATHVVIRPVLALAAIQEHVRHEIQTPETKQNLILPGRHNR